MISLDQWERSDGGDSVEPHPRIYLQRIPGSVWHVMAPHSGNVGGAALCGEMATEWHRIVEELPQGAVACGTCRAAAAFGHAVENDALIIGPPATLVRESPRTAAWAAGRSAERWLACKHQYQGPKPLRMLDGAPLHLREPVSVITRIARREARPSLLRRLIAAVRSW